MKCPNCSSQMFITDETASLRSQVTFYRCSLCVNKYVSSEPILGAASQEAVGNESNDYFARPATVEKRYLMA